MSQPNENQQDKAEPTTQTQQQPSVESFGTFIERPTKCIEFSFPFSYLISMPAKFILHSPKLSDMFFTKPFSFLGVQFQLALNKCYKDENDPWKEEIFFRLQLLKDQIDKKAMIKMRIVVYVKDKLGEKLIEGLPLSPSSRICTACYNTARTNFIYPALVSIKLNNIDRKNLINDQLKLVFVMEALERTSMFTEEEFCKKFHDAFFIEPERIW